MLTLTGVVALDPYSNCKRESVSAGGTKPRKPTQTKVGFNLTYTTARVQLTASVKCYKKCIKCLFVQSYQLKLYHAVIIVCNVHTYCTMYILCNVHTYCTMHEYIHSVQCTMFIHIVQCTSTYIVYNVQCSYILYNVQCSYILYNVQCSYILYNVQCSYILYNVQCSYILYNVQCSYILYNVQCSYCIVL